LYTGWLCELLAFGGQSVPQVGMVMIMWPL